MQRPCSWTLWMLASLCGQRGDRHHCVAACLCVLQIRSRLTYELHGSIEATCPAVLSSVMMRAPCRLRAVLADQDVLHRIVAPSRLAGSRPRYSLVWKLAFLPKRSGQVRSRLSCPPPVSLAMPCLLLLSFWSEHRHNSAAALFNLAA